MIVVPALHPQSASKPWAPLVNSLLVAMPVPLVTPEADLLDLVLAVVNVGSVVAVTGGAAHLHCFVPPVYTLLGVAERTAAVAATPPCLSLLGSWTFQPSNSR